MLLAVAELLVFFAICRPLSVIRLYGAVVSQVIEVLEYRSIRLIMLVVADRLRQCYVRFPVRF